MTIGSDNLGNGAGTQDRFAEQLGYRPTRRETGGLASDGVDGSLLPRNGSANSIDRGASALEQPESRTSPSLPSLPSLDGLAEPVFTPPDTWPEVTGSLADHPLLRGLLLELPPKGSVPAPGWLDRWFEAARCILELLYLQESARSR